MALNIYAKFEGKLTCAFKNDMRNFANFHQSTFEGLKIWTFIGSLIQNRKCMSLKFVEELCVMKLKNDAKIEVNLTCQFKIEMRNLTNFNPSTRKT